MTTPTPTHPDRTAEIRARVEAATSEQPGPWTVNLWPADEHDCGAEGEVINAAGNAALSLLGSAAYVALGANAPADLAFLLEENDRLRDEAALASGAADYHAERAALMERERDAAWATLDGARTRGSA